MIFIKSSYIETQKLDNYLTQVLTEILLLTYYRTKNPEKGLIQHLNKNDVQKIVGEVLNEAVKSPSNCGAGEGEYFGCENLR